MDLACLIYLPWLLVPCTWQSFSLLYTNRSPVPFGPTYRFQARRPGEFLPQHAPVTFSDDSIESEFQTMFHCPTPPVVLNLRFGMTGPGDGNHPCPQSPSHRTVSRRYDWRSRVESSLPEQFSNISDLRFLPPPTGLIRAFALHLPLTAEPLRTRK